MKRLFVLLFFPIFLIACADPIRDSRNILNADSIVSSSVSGQSNESHFNNDFNQVRLVYALPFSYAVSGMSWNYSDFVVHVKNLGSASSRRVFIHYENGASWADLELGLTGNYSGHSTYTGRLNNKTTVRFAVRYQTDAGTWWDNNRNADYWITPWSASGNYKPGVAGGGIGLLNATAELVTFGGGSTAWRIRGQIVIDKAVFPSGVSGGGIHIKNQYYGTDFWQTFYHLTLAYTMTSGSNLSVYDFESDPVANQPAPPASPIPMDSFLEYVIFAYKNINASTAYVYWDNNFDGNYRNDKVHGMQIQ